MTKFDEIFTVANKLANEGKKPTVALIKNKLSQPTPLPQIIQAIKVWQHDPEFVEIASTIQVDENKEPTTTSIKQEIELAIEPLMNELRLLKQEIKELKKDLKNKN